MKDIIINEFNDHINAVSSILNLTDEFATAAQICIDCLKNGGKNLRQVKKSN
jgi:phosphoheptose isomerase